MVKKVLYIGAFELPDKNAASHRVLNNAKCLKKLGIGSVFLDMQKDNFSSNKEVIDGDMLVYHRKYPKSKFEYINYGYSISSFKKVMNENSDIDTVVVYNIFSLVFLRILLYCKLHKLNIISDCSEWYSASKFNLIKKFDIFLRMHFLNKKCDGIIVISDYLARFYKNQHIVKIPPLVDLTDNKWKIRKENNNNEVVFSYCGFPEKKERLDYFINALSSDDLRNENFSFFIAGITERKFIEKNPNVNRSLFGKKIFFLGKISHAESLQRMVDSDYGVIVREKTRTNNAGFPTKFVEYKTLNTPVICNQFSDIKNYCNDDDIIFDEINYNSIYLAVKKALKKSKQRECENMVFDYNNYLDCFRNFLKNI